MAEGRLTLEEVTKAIQNAVRDYNLRLGDRGAFYNPPDEPQVIELDMERFNRSARAIARGKEKIAALIRNAKPHPSSSINHDTSNISVEGSDPSSPVAEPPLLASTPHLAAMTPSRATEPPGSVQTTVGAYTLLQSYSTPSSVAQPAHRQRTAAHDPSPLQPSHSTSRPAQQAFQS